MKKAKEILVLGLAAVWMLSGCQSIQGQKTEEPTPQETAAVTPGVTVAETPTPTEAVTPEAPAGEEQSGMVRVTVSKEIISADGAYSIKIPENWEDMQDQINAAFTIEVGSMEEGAFLTLSSEDKNGSVLKDIGEFTSTLAGYVAGRISDHQIGERIQSEIDGKASYKQKITGAMEDVNTAYWIYTIDGTSQFIQINAWSDAEHADRAELFFDQIVNSFQEITS